MNSREKILQEIAQNKPALMPLPVLDFEQSDNDNIQQFLDVLYAIGGQGKAVAGGPEVSDFLLQKISEGLEVVNGIKALSPCNGENYSGKSSIALESVDIAFIQGGLAIAENGAIWVPEQNMVNRMLPFICEQLVLVINEAEIVATMHDAYAKIKVDNEGYGVFIAGPSKTADIEQSLVIGAHGPLSLLVFIMEK